MDNNHSSIRTVGYPFNLCERMGIMSHHIIPHSSKCYCDRALNGWVNRETETNNKDVEYCEYLYQLDKAVKDIIGMSYRDLPDIVDVYAEYDAGSPPDAVARRIVRAAAREFHSIPADMIEGIFDV